MPKIETELYTTLRFILNTKPMQRSSKLLATTIDCLKEQIVNMESEVLQKLVERTCNTFEANALDEAEKYKAAESDEAPESDDLNESDEAAESDGSNESDESAESDDERSENTLVDVCIKMIEDRYAEFICRDSFSNIQRTSSTTLYNLYKKFNWFPKKNLQ